MRGAAYVARPVDPPLILPIELASAFAAEEILMLVPTNVEPNESMAVVVYVTKPADWLMTVLDGDGAK